MNTLTLTGSFSIAEAHSWLALCLAEVPERCPQAETVTFNFRSTFNGGTQLQANYSYRSDNLSTIVILRDVISRIVSMGQIKVHIACDINEESIKKCLELIWPKLEYQSRLVRQLELARGLKVNFKNISFGKYLKFVYVLSNVLFVYCCCLFVACFVVLLLFCLLVCCCYLFVCCTIKTLKLSLLLFVNQKCLVIVHRLVFVCLFLILFPFQKILF
ncbi:unnamed protein product [Meloidogyne enterolobii]|uniref:Uncharacterized protein n=1 Tax=Meloidogyne enterolobii TaxID=390850 RepID=A0ACB0ZI07_MELEN